MAKKTKKTKKRAKPAISKWINLLITKNAHIQVGRLQAAIEADDAEGGLGSKVSKHKAVTVALVEAMEARGMDPYEGLDMTITPRKRRCDAGTGKAAPRTTTRIPAASTSGKTKATTPRPPRTKGTATITITARTPRTRNTPPPPPTPRTRTKTTKKTTKRAKVTKKRNATPTTKKKTKKKKQNTRQSRRKA